MHDERSDLERAVADAVVEASIRSVANRVGIPKSAVHSYVQGRQIPDEHLAKIEATFGGARIRPAEPPPEGPDLGTLRAAVAATESLRAVADAATVSKSAVSDFVRGKGTPRARTVLRLRRWYWDTRARREG